MQDFKNIHIGHHIRKIAELRELSISRACLFLKCSHEDILNMYNQETLDSGILLRWCKLLNYNFFMFYHTHLQLYKPAAATTNISPINTKENKGYAFRKNLYSPDIITWILEKINSGELTIKDVIEKYHIPKTTIYRWKKRSNNNLK